MIRKLLLASAAAVFATAANAHPNNNACPAVTLPQLKKALRDAIASTGNASGLGLGLNMWATIVAPDGRVCLVANSSGDPIQGQWLASRVISAQKAFTAATLSLGATPDSGSGTPNATGKFVFSTANLYTQVNPGGTLYGLQHSNPVAAANAYGDRIGANGYFAGPYDTSSYGTPSDPMIGQVIGGINVFGGGLSLFAPGKIKVGGVGVSGDTSCQDHFISWWVRKNLKLDHLAGVGGVGGAVGPDNIVFDVIPNSAGGTGSSPSGWGHPACLGKTAAQAQTAADGLPAVQP